MTQTVGPHHDSHRVTHGIGVLAATKNLAHIYSIFMKKGPHQARYRNDTREQA